MLNYQTLKIWISKRNVETDQKAPMSFLCASPNFQGIQIATLPAVALSFNFFLFIFVLQ